MTAVGIVGAGQLARMTAEAASALGLGVTVLAEREEDPAVPVAETVLFGPADDPDGLRELARHCEVVTFDHEQVDLGLLARLEDDGAIVRPGVAALRFGVDKGHMRTTLAAAGVAVPAYTLVDPADWGAEAQLARFAGAHPWPLVAKPTHGGYDGKGVWPVEDYEQASRVLARCASDRAQLLFEETVPIEAELAVLVARRPGGDSVSWPAVETAQVGGMCREILVPGTLDPEVRSAARSLAERVADVAGAVGVLAVEMFWAGGRLLVNELAPRPHNSGHWTIEGSVTSQFENHLRAILDLPLGPTEPTAPAVACVNVLGDAGAVDPRSRLAGALAVPGAHVHLYGKAPRPGRKLGHVTVCGSDGEDVRSRAWTAACALGTPALPRLSSSERR